MTTKLNAILFDLGDTLLDFGKVDLPHLFEQGAHLAYEYLQTFGKPLPDFARYRRRHLRAIHWHELVSRLTGREFNSLEVMGQLCRRMNLNLTREQLFEVCWLWYEPLSRQASVEDGLAAMLRGFQQRGLKLGLVSNTFIPGEVLDQHLASVGLLGLLPTRVYSCDVGRRKPHPSLFTEAMHRMDIRPDETIFVGDLPKTDVRGSKRMGMLSVLKDRAGRHANARYQPDHTIKSILELNEIVEKYTDDPA